MAIHFVSTAFSMGCSRFSYRLILLPSFAGLVCYSCSTRPDDVIESQSIDLNSSGALQSQLEVPKPLSSTSSSPLEETASVSAVSISSEAYQEGLELASGAHALTQSALSPDDWDLIASRWQRAIDALKKVAVADENYASAQQKITEYTLNAEAAKEQLIRLRTPVYVPLASGAHSARSAQNSISPTANSASTVSPSAQSVQIPIVRRLHGTPVVLVTFNDTKTYEMILDTGASRTLITRQMANELGIVPTERMLAATASQSEVSFDIGRASSIAIEDVVLRNAPVTIGDAVSVGLLGNDFLRGYDITIRAQENVVELVRSR